jgi:DNA-binding response OmpR family regulator
VSEAQGLFARQPFDVAVLDLNLADGDGLGLLRRQRKQGLMTPVLLLTARDTLDDKLAGFDAGADDYLVKPFALKEVEARLLALSRRRAPRLDGGKWQHGPLHYDAALQQVFLDDQPLRLTPKGIKLLATFLQTPGRVFTRRELEVAVWGHALDSSDNLRSLLHTVRKQLGDRATIENRHGLGYSLAA